MQKASNWGLLGHEWAVDLLQGHLKQARFRHAYLITGPQGVGRRTLALRAAQALNCPETSSPGIPCGQCSTCQRIQRMQHPDLIVVQSNEVGATLKVEQVRELQRGLSLAPYEATYKIALLLRFEEANPSAANALLKTLEEPPRQVVLFLTAQDSEILLPTIVSRCEHIRLRPLGIDETAQGLDENWGIPPEEARLLAHVSNGRPGYALQLHNDPDQMQQRQQWLDDHQHMLSANRVERFNYAEAISKDKRLLRSIVQTWLSLWRDILMRASGASTKLTNLDCRDHIDHLAGAVGATTAQGVINDLEGTLEHLAHNTNPRLTSEVLLLNLPRLS